METDAAEREYRHRVIAQLLESVGMFTTPERIAAYAAATSSVPLYWLTQGCRKLAATWHGERHPVPQDLFLSSFREAGFRNIHNGRTPEIDATIDQVKWWPLPGQRVPERFAAQWFLRAAGERLNALQPGSVSAKIGPGEKHGKAQDQESAD